MRFASFNNSHGLKCASFSCCGRHFILSVIASSMLSPLAPSSVEAAMPALNPDSAAFVQPDEDKKSALSALSGSQWPGIIDHLLQKPVDGNGGVGIHLNYPSVGKRAIDSDIRNWVEGLANAFETHLDLGSQLSDGFIAETDNDSSSFLREFGPFLQDDDLYSEDSAREAPSRATFELWGDYSISRPSPDAISITYELWNYAGQPQGNLDILTLNYNLHNGQRLALVDIFENPDHALEIMSAWSRKVLGQRLGDMHKGMLNLGTEPLIENFSSLTLVPEGIRINFQPLQVAPWEAGIQKVTIPVEQLLPAGPLLVLWGRQ